MDELKPQADDVVIYKPRYSGFYHTDLDSTLKSWESNIYHHRLYGWTTNVCVESMVRDAMSRDDSCVLLAN